MLKSHARLQLAGLDEARDGRPLQGRRAVARRVHAHGHALLAVLLVQVGRVVHARGAPGQGLGQRPRDPVLHAARRSPEPLDPASPAPDLLLLVVQDPGHGTRQVAPQFRVADVGQRRRLEPGLVAAAAAASQLLKLGVAGLKGQMAVAPVAVGIVREAPGGRQVRGHEQDGRADAQRLKEGLHLTLAAFLGWRRGFPHRYLDACNARGTQNQRSDKNKEIDK